MSSRFQADLVRTVDSGRRLAAKGPAQGVQAVSAFQDVFDDQVVIFVQPDPAQVGAECVPIGHLHIQFDPFVPGPADLDFLVDAGRASVQGQDVVAPGTDAEDVPALSGLFHVPQVHALGFEGIVVLHAQVGRPGDPVGFEEEGADVLVGMAG